MDMLLSGIDGVTSLDLSTSDIGEDWEDGAEIDVGEGGVEAERPDSAEDGQDNVDGMSDSDSVDDLREDLDEGNFFCQLHLVEEDLFS